MSRPLGIRLLITLWVAVFSTHVSMLAAAAPITLTYQERRVAAAASLSSPDSEVVLDTEAGAFSNSVSASSDYEICITTPFGSKCVSWNATGRAAQDSIIAITSHGSLEVRARGSTLAGVSNGSSDAQSSLEVTFEVTEAADFDLRSEASGHVTVVLENALGTVVDWPTPADDTSQVGRLTPGSWTLRLAADSAGTIGNSVSTSDYDLRFSVATPPDTRLRCDLEAGAPSYTVGEVATIETLSVSNLVPDHQALEMKLWLRLPDGQVLPAVNEGADASLLIPAGVSQDFGPVEVLAVDMYSAPGVYEFGCRLLDPSTGAVLFDESELFEVRF